MQKNLKIPSKINVGFQNRIDTYSGKLAYVVYTDTDGKIKKVNSWNNWKDSKIETKEFDNVPTSGFVLNKKVGEGRYGWNPRRAWVRVYDPRDFEFEISVANLLFILEETSAVKGKGLEGEFVYSWDKSELVLLPASSQEYKSSVAYTTLQTKKVTAKEVKEGCTYVTKDNKEVMYLGKQFFYINDWHGLRGEEKHVFVTTDGKSTYSTLTSFAKLAVRTGEGVSPDYAEEFEKFKNSDNGSAPSKLLGKLKIVKPSTWQQTYCFVKIDDKFYAAAVIEKNVYTNSWNHAWTYPLNNMGSPTVVDTTQNKRYIITRSNKPVELSKAGTSKPEFGIETKMELSELDFKVQDFYDLIIENEAGNLLEFRSGYYY